MIIKKHKNKNKYLLSNQFYIRDFTQIGVPPVDLNAIKDNDLLVDNELENFSQRYPSIDSEEFYHPKIVIVSDGYNFTEEHKILADLPKDVVIIAVNGALKKWQLVGEHAVAKRNINYYVVNNPFKECEIYLPKHRYYPRCIASIRTNPAFLKEYRGLKYIYYPVNTEVYSGVRSNPGYRIDDYRNPICAALGLAYHFAAQKILLFCCDDSFNYEKPTALKLENGLWHYPQQELSQNIIDANCYWLKTKDITVGNYSSGRIYENAVYIKKETDIMEFLND